MPLTIKQALDQEKKGYHIGHRLVLPFRCQVIKIIFHKEIFTELVGGRNVKLNQDPKNTSIYIRSAGKLTNYVNSYEVIKLIVAEWDADLTDIDTHTKIICEIKDSHVVDLHVPSSDMIFIE